MCLVIRPSSLDEAPYGEPDGNACHDQGHKAQSFRLAGKPLGKRLLPCSSLSLLTLSRRSLALKLGLRFGCSLVCFEPLLFKLALPLFRRFSFLSFLARPFLTLIDVAANLLELLLRLYTSRERVTCGPGGCGLPTIPACLPLKSTRLDQRQQAAHHPSPSLWRGCASGDSHPPARPHRLPSLAVDATAG